MENLSVINQIFCNLLKNTSKFKDSVVVINSDGVVLEDDLDEMPYNHANLTCYMGLKLKIPYLETSFSYMAGKHLASYGALVLHTHKGGLGIVFFPNNITEVQYHILNNKLVELEEFCYQFEGSKEECAYVTGIEVLDYAKSLVVKANKSQGRYTLKRQRIKV